MITLSSIITFTILVLYFIILLSYNRVIESQRREMHALRINLIEAFNLISQIADANKELAKEMKTIALGLDDIAIELEVQAQKEAKATDS